MKDTLRLTLQNRFTWKERFKILFGCVMVNETECEVEFVPPKKKGEPHPMKTTVKGVKTWVVQKKAISSSFPGAT